MAELSPQLEALSSLCDSLTQDTRLAEFLALLLQLGNYLNAVSYGINAIYVQLLTHVTFPKQVNSRTEWSDGM